MKTIEWNEMDPGPALNGIRHSVVKRFLSPSRRYHRMLSETQWWSEDELKTYQFDQLQRLVQLAYKYVPYYRGMMEIFDVKPQDIQSLDDIVKMPLLEKDTIRRRSSDLVSTAKAYPTLYKCHTSGTTGTPLTLYRDLKNIGFEYAMLSRQRRWAGLQPSDRYATLKGELIPDRKTSKGVFWTFSPAENKLIMSSYHVSEQTVDRYVHALRKYKVEAIDGYPSSLYALARFILKRNIKLPLKAILTSSETLVPEQKLIIESAFNCVVYDYYGMAERVAAIHTCEFGHYHLVPEYSLVEFLKTSDLIDGHFEVVGTSFTNDAMPLIRYRVGDVVELGSLKCECGRNYQVVNNIVGRTDDYIVTPSGKLVGRLDHIFKGARNLIQAQIYQPDPEHIVLRVVPDQGFSKSDGDLIIEKLNRRLGEDMNFEIQNVTSIPRSGRGKLKSVISSVEIFAN